MTKQITNFYKKRMTMKPTSGDAERKSKAYAGLSSSATNDL